jgi:hypothetical protein
MTASTSSGWTRPSSRAGHFALYSLLAAELRGAYERNGGHDPWVASPDEARAFIDANAIRGFELSSSIGAAGAIWSRGFLTFTDERGASTPPGARS